MASLNVTPLVVAVDDMQPSITVTLKSSNSPRRIEFSTDGGIEYFTPAYDNNTPTMLIVVSTLKLSHIRFTGAVNDNWSIR